MKNYLFFLLLGMFLFVPLIAASAPNSINTSKLEQVVSAFQKLPTHDLLCKEEAFKNWEPIKVGTIFEPYLSKEFYKLFLWTQCRNTNIPPFYSGFDNLIPWDIRFGFGYGSEVNLGESIRVSHAKLKGSSKAIINVFFDYGTLKNITTTYTLIREDGHWKIDDIAPKGDEPNEYNGDTALEHSDSIKTDM